MVLKKRIVKLEDENVRLGGKCDLTPSMERSSAKCIENQTGKNNYQRQKTLTPPVQAKTPQSHLQLKTRLQQTTNRATASTSTIDTDPNQNWKNKESKAKVAVKLPNNQTS